jgi:hypothetical protein
MSPEKKGEVKAKQLAALKRLGHKDLQLDEYERMWIWYPHYTFSPADTHFHPGTVANEVIHPDDIPIRFSGELTIR